MADMEGLIYVPIPAEVEREQLYWSHEDMRREVSEWEVSHIEAEWDFATWPLADLMRELDLVRTLTPDQFEIMEELGEQISRRMESAA
jgi:hypothetical protein